MVGAGAGRTPSRCRRSPSRAAWPSPSRRAPTRSASTFSSIKTNVTVVDRGLLTYAAGTSSAMAAALSASGSAFATSYGAARRLGRRLHRYRYARQRRAETPRGRVPSRQSTSISSRWTPSGSTSRARPAARPVVGQELNPVGQPGGFSASIEAYGDNGYVDLQVDALALEDQLSSTTLLGTAAIDGDVSYASAMPGHRKTTSSPQAMPTRWCRPAGAMTA